MEGISPNAFAARAKSSPRLPPPNISRLSPFPVLSRSIAFMAHARGSARHAMSSERHGGMAARDDSAIMIFSASPPSELKPRILIESQRFSFPDLQKLHMPHDSPGHATTRPAVSSLIPDISCPRTLGSVKSRCP